MKCLICEKIFVNKRNPKAKCCSRKCNATLQVRKRAKSYWESKPKKFCVFCNAEIKKYTKTQKFCSVSCKTKEQNKRRSLESRFNNKEMLNRMYTLENLSIKDISIRLQCSQTAVHKWLHRLEIPVRGRSEATKGMEKSQEHRKKISSSRKREKKWQGKNNPTWSGGKSFKEYGKAFNNNLKAIIKHRDENKCRLCSCNGVLSIHHIDYNKKNNNSTNLISLCRSCHSKTNHSREAWKQIFERLVKRG